MPVGSVKKALVAEVGVDLSSFKRGMRRANRLAGRAGRGLKTAFKAAGAAAAAMGAAITAAIARGIQKAAEFQGEMRRLQTLVGVGADQMGEFRDSILRLAPAVGKGPRELSKALFAITSGGLEGAQAMRTLEASAKASAIGLGNMTQIGRTATAALQAFGDEGLTAQGAVDQMVATVREGNIEASELTGALGKVIGMADAMGVSFAEMNAFVATFTRLGVEARIATTSLRATLSTLAKPSTEQRETFQELGTSVRGFRQEIQQKGLAQALRALIQRSQGNIETLSKLIPNVRALAGVLGTAGSQGESFSEIQKNIRESMGLTSEGFQQAKKDLDQLIARIKAAKDVLLIRVGEQFAPFVQQFLGDPANIKLVADVFVGSVRAMVASIQTLLRAGKRIVESPVSSLLGIKGPTEQLAEAQQTIDNLRVIRRQLKGAREDASKLADLNLPKMRAFVEQFTGRDVAKGAMPSDLVGMINSEIQALQQTIDKEGGLVDQTDQWNANFERSLELLDMIDARLSGINTGGIARQAAGGAGGGGGGGGGSGGGSGASGGGRFSAIVGGANRVTSSLQAMSLETVQTQQIFVESIGTMSKKAFDAFKRINQVIQRTMVEGIASVASSIGKALAGVAKGTQSMVDTVKTILADLMSSIGRTLIAFGVAGQAIQSFMFNPATAIAAGAALVALGAALKSTVKDEVGKAAEDMQSFAEGGIVEGMGGRGVAVMAHPGEAVLTPGAVQAIGGPGEVARLNQRAGPSRGGGVVDAAAEQNGGGGSGNTFEMHFHGRGGSRSVADEVRDAIMELDRQGRLPG